jgi:hypothetical protein
MRKTVVFLALALVGCSKQSPNEGAYPSENATEQVDVAERKGPDVGPTAVAGVAMTYAYNFLLPAQQVAATQEKHASQCEALGPARCRITSMKYHAGRDRTISGELSLKLAPELARGFGKHGIDAVVAVGGMLEDAEIDSSEEGATIAAAQREDISLAAEQKALGDQLAKATLDTSERTQLQARLASLRDARRTASATQADSLLKLASTPMTFSYRSGQVDPGLNDGPWLGAIKDGWANVMAGVPAFLTILITLAPWIAVFVLIIWLWRRFGRRLGLSPRDEL